MTLPILSEFTRNPNQMEFHVRVEISKRPIESFCRPLRPSSEKYLAEVGEKGAELVRMVMAIPGVIEVFISPYRLTIRKGSLFEWKEIAHDVEKAIKVVFGGEKEREEIKYLSLAEIPLSVILTEPFKRLGWIIRKMIRDAWYRIPNLAE